jgi:DNA-directed RNA polymerase subunit N (RpoN/RPB10)
MPINTYYKSWRRKLKKGVEPRDILDSFGFERFCCRRMFMGHGGEAVEKCMMAYAGGTPEDRIIEVGVKSTTFKDTRDDVKKIIGEVSDEEE